VNLRDLEKLTPKKFKQFARPDKPLANALLEAMDARLKDIIDTGDYNSGRAYSINGAELDYQKWLKTYAPHAASSSLGEHHKRAWEWAENIVQGEPPPALIECWFRGGGKSTTMELVSARIAVKGTRRFLLYVCSTQEAADRHVTDIATTMERCGIERAMNRYGFSKGWNASKLRTANGFNVLAFGLDTGARGVKLDHLRPDFIILDDIDELDDSVTRVDKKIATITQTILPAKSNDCAIVFVQNRIHANSVMSQVISGELDMLQNRIQSPIVPAVLDLRYEPIEKEDGRMGYKIIGGTASWEHKSLEVCQREIDDYGLISFLRECQHDVGVGGKFFPEFKQHDEKGNPWHVVDLVDVKPWWRVWASHDFGTNSPCAFILFASDDVENIYVIGEVYKNGMVSSQQADAALELLRAREMAAPVDKDIPGGQWNTKLEAIAFDWGNTFPPEKYDQRIGEYPVEVWWRKGLPAVRAVKDRKAGWRRLKEWLAASRMTDGVVTPRFRILRNSCPNLIRELEAAMADPKDPEDLDNGTKSDHALDSCRYGVMWREYPVKCDEVKINPKTKPHWLTERKNEDYV
jgi:hypothetical protein